MMMMNIVYYNRLYSMIMASISMPYDLPLSQAQKFNIITRKVFSFSISNLFLFWAIFSLRDIIFVNDISLLISAVFFVNKNKHFSKKSPFSLVKNRIKYYNFEPSRWVAAYYRHQFLLLLDFFIPLINYNFKVILNRLINLIRFNKIKIIN